MKELLVDAQKNGYAVPAPNVVDQHSVMGCIRAAEEERSPLILDYGERAGQFESFSLVALPLIQQSRMPIALNLDHGTKHESSVRCIRAGFSSIMMDCSMLPLEENIRQVKYITDIAHMVGVTVEAELGHLVERNESNENSDKTNLTDPDAAVRFVAETGVDCLAVAIGTAHGYYKGKPFLDFERLEELRKVLEIPLVLHGGSGTGDEALQRAIGLGICKINIATDLFKPTTQAVKGYYQSSETPAFPAGNAIVTKVFAERLKGYMKLFGSSSRA